MPLVFCELALAYPPAKVSDPTQRIAAANGQFLLVEREAYRRWAATPAWPTRCWKTWSWPFWPSGARWACASAMPTTRSSTRMYRSTAAMIEGWTKNLALLFDNALALAVWRASGSSLLFGLPVLAVGLWNARLARTRWNGWARAGFWRCSGCARCSGSMRAWPSRTFLSWIARWRRWDCRCLSCCSIAAGFSTGF